MLTGLAMMSWIFMDLKSKSKITPFISSKKVNFFWPRVAREWMFCFVFWRYQNNCNKNCQKLSEKAKNISKLAIFRKKITHSYNADNVLQFKYFAGRLDLGSEFFLHFACCHKNNLSNKGKKLWNSRIK